MRRVASRSIRFRCSSGLDAIRLENPRSESEWTDIITSLIEQNEGEDQYIYLQVTRGVAKRDHRIWEPAETSKEMIVKA